MSFPMPHGQREIEREAAMAWQLARQPVDQSLSDPAARSPSPSRFCRPDDVCRLSPFERHRV